MIEKTTLDFLSKLKKNNSKEWFDKNRKTYDAARLNVELFLTDLIPQLSKYDKGLSNLSAKKCMFRINRDIRFSRDKSPYKTNFGASLNPGGKKLGTPGYYIHIAPGESFIAGGMYMMDPLLLNAVRQEIDYNLKSFNTILNDKKFKKAFGGLDPIELLKRPPKGYTEDNPAVEHLKHKHYIVSASVDDKTLLSKSFLKQTSALVETMQPFMAFLRQALD
jgi:uncharacterized protein (TIGR02453 family)